MDEGVIFYETVVLLWWGVETNVWFINKVKVNWPPLFTVANLPLVIKSVDKTNIRSLTLAIGYTSKLIESP